MAGAEYAPANIAEVVGCGEPLLRRTHGVSEVGQYNRIQDQGNRKHGGKPTWHSRRRPSVEKGNENQNGADGAEAEDAEQFALDAQDVAGDKLQSLKHRHEIPFGLDPDGSRLKGVGFFAQLCEVKSSESRKDAKSTKPTHQVTKEKIWHKGHDAL